MRCRNVGRCLRAWFGSVGQRLFADVVALVGAVDVVPLAGDPDVGTIFVVAAVVGFSLLPVPGGEKDQTGRGRKGQAAEPSGFPPRGPGLAKPG